jgi:hypothetical protein
MRGHIDKHRQECPNHKIPPTMLLNLFTIIVQDQGREDRGGSKKQTQQ